MLNKKWRKYNGVLIFNLSPHLEDDMSNVGELIRKTGSSMARWVTNFDCGIETDYWYIIKDSFAGIDEYSYNTRKSIRKGLRRLEVKQISKEILLNNGYEVYKQAFIAYKTLNKLKNKDVFIREIVALDEKWEFWGVFIKEDNSRMVGYSINYVGDDYSDFSITKFHPGFLKLRLSDALFFKMTEYYLGYRKLKYITGGSRNISHKTNIQLEYIRKFKFRKAFCKLNVHYNPFFKILVNILFPFRRLLKLFPINFFRKIVVVLKQESIRRNCKKLC